MNHLVNAKEIDVTKFEKFIQEANSRMKGMNVETEVIKMFNMLRPMELNLKDEIESGALGFKHQQEGTVKKG